MGQTPSKERPVAEWLKCILRDIRVATIANSIPALHPHLSLPHFLSVSYCLSSIKTTSTGLLKIWGVLRLLMESERRKKNNFFLHKSLLIGVYLNITLGGNDSLVGVLTTPEHLKWQGATAFLYGVTCQKRLGNTIDCINKKGLAG